jgi:hypothetical protein
MHRAPTVSGAASSLSLVGLSEQPGGGVKECGGAHDLGGDGGGQEGPSEWCDDRHDPDVEKDSATNLVRNPCSGAGSGAGSRRDRVRVAAGE